MTRLAAALTALLLVLAGAGCKHGPDLRLPRDPIEAARQLTRQGEPEEALKRLDSYLAGKPAELAAHRALVEAALAAGRLAEAEARYQKLLAAPGSAGLGRYGLGLVALARGPAGMAAALEAFALAEALVDEPELPYRIGRVLALDGRHAEAVVAFQRALGRGQPEPAVRLHLAASLARLGRAAEALEQLRAAAGQPLKPVEAALGRTVAEELYDPTRALPPEVAAEVHRAEEQLSQDLANQALAQLDGLLTRFPETAYLHTLRGLAHSRLQNDGQAIAAFEKALELQPADPVALVGLGDVYQRLERWSEARDFFERASALDPFDPEACQRLGNLALALNDFARALVALERLGMLLPDDLKVRYQLGQLLIREGRVDEALAVYEQLIERPEDDLAARLALAQIHLKLAESDPVARKKHREQALQHLDRADELAPDDARVAELRKSAEE
ncbi:MAG TPA: tetratricopeptide repeat protein [Myxococcota bacterium]|nr:tetratricopeptide repeat protein [Myxococcota bacterium]HRY91843.1 tetratricopeptide repeat protein [Myxococcota bacterium]HSA20570.1 tetratricopeptide repeat protein [Myxococcota bacterium]